MKMKTINVAQATNMQMDWLVAKCDGVLWLYEDHRAPCPGAAYTTDWALMGPIMARMAKDGLEIRTWPDHDELKVMVHTGYHSFHGTWKCFAHDDDSILIAAARCYVVSKLGDTVQVPEELA